MKMVKKKTHKKRKTHSHSKKKKHATKKKETHHPKDKKEKKFHALHEEIKKQLSKHVKYDEHKKEVAVEPEGKHEEPLKVQTEKPVETVKKPVHNIPVSGLDQFEKNLIESIEINEKESGIEVLIQGGFDLEKRIQIKTGQLPQFLKTVLPDRINSMDPGDNLRMVGLTTQEMSDLFKTSIIVEPKGELQVTEEDENGKICLNIGIEEDHVPLEHTDKGLEDVRMVVEKEREWMEEKSKELNKVQEENGEDSEDDWLKDQITSQHEEISKIADEMGESIKATNSIPSVKHTLTENTPKETEPNETEKANEPDEGGMKEFIEAYKEEANTYIQTLGKIEQLKENPKNIELMGELCESCNGLKSISDAMGFTNISKVTRSIEHVLEEYKNTGSIDLDRYDSLKEGVDRVHSLYHNLENSEKENVEDIIKRIGPSAE